MSVAEEEEELPQARRLAGRWPGLVWAVPLAALIIVAYLGVRALTRRGISVDVTFSYVESVTPGDTKVLLKGVEVGHVARVRVTPDAHHVDVTLSLDPRTRSALNSNTRFWLIGEHPSITDVQSIRAALAGVIIAMSPGQGGTPTRSFTGLDQPPIVPPNTAGTTYYLSSPTQGAIQPGAALLYRGLTIGRIVGTGLRGPADFRLEIFVFAPFDRMVRPGAQFWSGSPLRFSLSGAGVSAGLSSPASVLQGSVQFDLPEEARGRPRVPAGATFALDDDQSAAQQGPTGPEQRYRVAFDGAGGDLTAGAGVTLLGATVGRVISAKLATAPRPHAEAVLALYPRRLGIDLAAGQAPGDWRRATDGALARLLARGYRAQLTQSPPLVGARGVALAPVPGARAARLAGGLLPTLPAGGTGDDLFARLNRLPLDEIGANVRALTASLARITGSREVRDGLVHLDGTLRQLDAITAEARPKVGPLIDKLDRTAGELQATAAAARATLSGEGAVQGSSLPEAIGQLEQAARSIRSLTDYLGRHPEALLRGKAKEKP